MTIDRATTRRRFPRIPSDTMLSISPIENEHAMALSVDISECGMRLQCVGVELEIDQLVKITITLGRQTKVIVGKIVRMTDLDAHSKELAVAFVNLEDETRTLLEQHLLQH